MGWLLLGVLLLLVIFVLAIWAFRGRGDGGSWGGD